LTAALKDENPRMRRAAARGLHELGAPPDVVAPAMIAALADADPQVLANVADALATLGPAAVPKIVAALEIEELRGAALAVLGRMGPAAKDAVPALVNELARQDDPRRAEVQLALAAIGPDAAAAVPALVESLSSDDDHVRRTALYALGKIGPAASAAIPELRGHLRQGDKLRRVAVVWALLQIQPGDRRLVSMAVPLLIEALAADDSLVRREAALALGNLGAAARAAVEPLKARLGDDDPSVREAAAEALAKIGA
jgi:HEAT repeat protein